MVRNVSEEKLSLGAGAGRGSVKREVQWVSSSAGGGGEPRGEVTRGAAVDFQSSGTSRRTCPQGVSSLVREMDVLEQCEPYENLAMEKGRP